MFGWGCNPGGRRPLGFSEQILRLLKRRAHYLRKELAEREERLSPDCLSFSEQQCYFCVESR